MSKILVTGGTGLLGSHLLCDLLAAGHTVRALKRANSSMQVTERVIAQNFEQADEMLSQIEWVTGDVLDPYSLRDAIQGCPYVYHCAATVSFDPRDRAQLMKINVEGTANMVNIALEAQVKKFCHVSSIASLGRTKDPQQIDENTRWKNSDENSQYAISKYASEREVWRGIEEGLTAVIVNPSIILGNGDITKGSCAMFKTIWKTSRYYTTGINGFVDVKDVSQAMILLMESDHQNEHYIVSGGNFSYGEIFGMIAKGFQKKPPHVEIPKWLLELGWRIEKLRSILSHHKPLITRETVRTSQHQYFYSTQKLEMAIPIQFTPMQSTINRVCEQFQKEHGLKH